MRSLRKVSGVASWANRPRRLTQPPRLVETVTSGEAVTMRCVKSSSPRPISLRIAPKPACVEFTACCGSGSLSGTGIGGAFKPALAGGRERHALEKRLDLLGVREALELVPFVARPHIVRLAERIHLRRRHQAGVIVLVAGHRQAEALDRVADEAGRLVGLDAVEGFQHRRQIVAAEIVHQRGEFVVAALFDQLADVALVADLVVEPLAPGGAAGEHQRRIKLVGAGVDPGFQLVAARLLEGGAAAASRI